MYTLISKNAISFSVEKDVAEMSKLIRDACEDSDESRLEFPLMNVDDTILHQILELCEHHFTEEMPKISKPIPDNKTSEDLFGTWYDSYLNKLSKDNLFKIIMGANYMDIPEVMDICCARVACDLRGKTKNEIKDYLDVEDNLIVD